MVDELKDSDKQKAASAKGPSAKKKVKAEAQEHSVNAKANDSDSAPQGAAGAGDRKAATGADGAPTEAASASVEDILGMPGAGDPAVAGRPAPAKRVKGKAAQHVPSGIAHINATFNNTHVTITDRRGGVIAWSSAGRLGFAGAKKSSAYAATLVAQDAARQAAVCRLQEVEVRVQGPGSGRESAIRALQSAGLTVNAIQDVTPIPHNGCRPRKRRRV